MKPEDLEKLNSFCADFRSFRANNEDGQGKCLHDIKNTFDYVSRTVETYQLQGTRFGSNLTVKANDASKVLSQLWLCLQDLEKSLTSFITNQASNNNQVGNQGTSATTIATGSTSSSGSYGGTTSGQQPVNSTNDKSLSAEAQKQEQIAIKQYEQRQKAITNGLNTNTQIKEKFAIRNTNPPLKTTPVVKPIPVVKTNPGNIVSTTK